MLFMDFCNTHPVNTVVKEPLTIADTISASYQKAVGEAADFTVPVSMVVELPQYVGPKWNRELDSIPGRLDTIKDTYVNILDEEKASYEGRLKQYHDSLPQINASIPVKISELAAALIQKIHVICMDENYWDTYTNSWFKSRPDSVKDIANKTANVQDSMTTLQNISQVASGKTGLNENIDMEETGCCCGNRWGVREQQTKAFYQLVQKCFGKITSLQQAIGACNSSLDGLLALDQQVQALLASVNSIDSAATQSIISALEGLFSAQANAQLLP